MQRSQKDNENKILTAAFSASAILSAEFESVLIMDNFEDLKEEDLL